MVKTVRIRKTRRFITHEPNAHHNADALLWYAVTNVTTTQTPFCQFCYVTNMVRSVHCCALNICTILRVRIAEFSTYFSVWTHFVYLCTQNIKHLAQRYVIWDTPTVTLSSVLAPKMSCPVFFKQSCSKYHKEGPALSADTKETTPSNWHLFLNNLWLRTWEGNCACHTPTQGWAHTQTRVWTYHKQGVAQWQSRGRTSAVFWVLGGEIINKHIIFMVKPNQASNQICHLKPLKC